MMNGMAEFASLHSYAEFEQSVRTKRRFVHDDEVTRFLRTVIDTAKPHRLSKIPKDKVLFRAQRGFVRTTEPSGTGEDEDAIESIDVEAALPPERMVPKAECVGNGRINPRGIPCLYLATTASAAISEMRPWVGEYITLAQFKVVCDCLVVDCSLSTMRSDWLEPVNPNEKREPDASEKENGVWGDIGFAFSKPVTIDEEQLGYVPTQILAETLRDRGYHGIVYKSLLDEPGKNIALFNLASATLISRCLYRIRSVALESAKLESVPSTWPESILSELRPGRKIF
jgi:hypothetical protein